VIGIGPREETRILFEALAQALLRGFAGGGRCGRRRRGRFLRAGTGGTQHKE
jgi:hypothetical protein